MIKTNQLRKLFTILSVSFFASCYAQEVDTIEINGEQYFVYPFKIETSEHMNYFYGQKSGSLNENISYNEYLELMLIYESEEEVMSKKEFKQLKRRIRKMSSSEYEYNQEDLESKYLKSKKFAKAIRENPYPLLQQRFQLSNDLTPMLDPIPDGKYIQLYEEFCLVDKKGNCNIITDQVAGYFTMKNNVLDGEATWVDFKGDTLKHGWFVNGNKIGEWKLERRNLDYNLSDDQAKLYIDRGYPELDTLTQYITFENGIQSGPYRQYNNSEYPTEEGFYLKNEPSGEWIRRDVAYTGFGKNEKRNRNNELITQRIAYETDDSLVVHPRWIRKELIEIYGSDRDQFNFYPTYSRPDLPSEMYEIAYKVEENLELEEELEGAPYDLDFYEDERYYYGISYEAEYYQSTFGYDDYEAKYYDKTAEKYFSRGVLLDSIGARPKYAGVYEARYENGQLAYKYVFENGLLLKEDTVFWDNGLPHDVISEIPDSNQYLRSIYDYDGKNYIDLIYDSLGDFVRIEKAYSKEEVFVIDGFKVTSDGYSRFYFYDVFDTLNTTTLTEPTELFRSWYINDSSLLYATTYYPEDRRLSINAHSVVGSQYLNNNKSFSEDFESWTGKMFTRIGDLELQTTRSGSLYEYYTADSIPIRHIREDNIFNVASEHVLNKGGQPYTGPVELNLGAKKFNISKDDLTMSLPDAKHTEKKLVKDLARYRKKGKTKYPTIMNFIDASETDTDLSDYVFRSFFSEPLGGFIQTTDEYYYEGEYGEITVKGKNAPAKMAKIEGYMIDGKPNGLWVGFDQFGKKMVELTYANGEANGQVTYYDYAFPVEKNAYDEWLDMEYENPFKDSFPAKRVHYVSSVSNYLNGKAQGKSYQYTWYGEITSESNYEDDFRDGLSIERNKLATTLSTYKNGEADGYVKTYLTLQPGDSILLYNLNFQDGLLQGESKSFHTNGKLAKRGFFLNGQPIEDYEAYDSLGFRYHYVKFQYSFPIEEKIWEENELSVRYLFDWQDSILFEPTDITTSQSLEAVVAQLGLGGDYFERPYYGRKSLVNKNRVNYHMTKYYPNDTIARDGDLDDGRKVGCWKYYGYNGDLLYEVDYFDTIVTINDSVRFKSKGVLTDFDSQGNPLYESYVIEMSSKYDCSHTDHYEIRQLYTRWEADDSLGRMNGFVQNFYDNGTLQSEGMMKNGLPDGIWKGYDPYGKLNQYGNYVLGKRDARWLSGDLSKTKYLGDICLNPNLPDLEEEMKYRENLLDVKITNYRMGVSLNTQYYDINMNAFIDAEEMEEEETDGEEMNESIEEE